MGVSKVKKKKKNCQVSSHYSLEDHCDFFDCTFTSEFRDFFWVGEFCSDSLVHISSARESVFHERLTKGQRSDRETGLLS